MRFAAASPTEVYEEDGSPRPVLRRDRHDLLAKVGLYCHSPETGAETPATTLHVGPRPPRVLGPGHAHRFRTASSTGDFPLTSFPSLHARAVLWQVMVSDVPTLFSFECLLEILGSRLSSWSSQDEYSCRPRI